MRFTIFAVFIVPLAALAAPSPFPKTHLREPLAIHDLRSLQGVWEWEARRMRRGKVIITGNRIKWHIGNKLVIEEFFRLNPHTSPKSIDLINFDSGAVLQGVYEINTNELLINLPVEVGHPRPTAIADQHDGETLTILRRVVGQ